MDRADAVEMPVKGRLTTAGAAGRTDVRVACAILAGGKASRYGGAAKGLLPLGDGVTIIERMLVEVTAAGIFDAVIVANEEEAYRSCGRQIVRDSRPGLGSLGGTQEQSTCCG